MNSTPSAQDDALKAFRDFTTAEASATVKLLVEQAARPTLAELEAFRAALDARLDTIAAALAGGAAIDPAPVQALAERIAQAAGEEAAAAAHAARALAAQEADARLALDRAEAQKQLDAMREEAAEERDASQRERNALAGALESARQQADALRADRDAQLEALRVAQAHADALRGDRDAQLEALRVAQEHADALRGDRDAQLEALRGAQEHADMLRADRDAQLEALRGAQEHADALRADRDAQLEELKAAAERVAAMATERDAHRRTAEAAVEGARTVQGEQDALLEAARISNARHTRLLEQAESRAGAAEARAAAAEDLAAEARAQVETAQAQLAAAHAQTEAARAQLAVAQAQLVDAQDRLAAARAEAERRLATGASEIEALRLELERVRADMESTHAAERVNQAVDTAPAEAPAVAAVETIPPHTPAAGPATARAVDEPEPAELYAAEPEPVTQSAPRFVPLLAVAEPDPVPAPGEIDAVGVMYRAISGAGDLSQVLDALVDGVGSLFPRAALFVVKTRSKRLQGWRSVGFTGPAAITREFEFPLTTDSALTRAVMSSRTIFTGEGQPGAQAGEAWTVTFPVTTGGRVVAVVHADGGERTGETAEAFDRERSLDLARTLVSMAGERIGVLTMSARAAFGNVMSVTPAQPASVASGGAPVSGAHANGTPVNGSQQAPMAARSI